MKKSAKILSVVLILSMIFSFSAFAAKDALTVVSVKCGEADLKDSTVDGSAAINIVFSNNVTTDKNGESTLLATNTQKIAVRDSAGTAAPATVSAGADEKTITVTLGGLAKGNYTLEIDKELTAKNEATLGETLTYAFQVKGEGGGKGDGKGDGSGGGNNPLNVKEITVNGSALKDADLKGNETITITFDRGMTENEEANKALITVKKEDGANANIVVGKVVDKNTVTIELKDLEPGKYTLVLGKDIKANNGNTLGKSNEGKDYEVDFTVRIAETNCDCWCHETGFKAVLWNIYIFFCKLFGANEVCKCGAVHY